MSDPFEHFEDKFLSHELINQNRAALVEEAQDFLDRHSGLEPVGLILEGSAAEARPFLAALEKALGRKLVVPGFLGVVPRPFAVEILRANCPAALDNLPNGEIGSKLPVLAVTKGGFRFDVVEYDTM